MGEQDFAITVVGSANVDMIMQLERFPAAGETVSDGKFSQAFGGKGANQAVAAARAGAHVAFLGSVGNDDFGEATIRNLQRDGIFTEAVQRCAQAGTGIALILIDKKGENCIAAAPGANNALSPEHVERHQELLGRSQLVVMQAEIALPAIRRTLQLVRKTGTPLLFNLAPIRKAHPALSPRMTYLVVNETEATSLSGLKIGSISEAKRAAEALQMQGPKHVLLTLGAKGVWVATSKESFHVPAFAVKAVDSTAAGDVFCGAFAAAITALGASLQEAVRFACAASAICVTRLGAQPSIPYREEVESFLTSARPVRKQRT